LQLVGFFGFLREKKKGKRNSSSWQGNLSCNFFTEFLSHKQLPIKPCSGDAGLYQLLKLLKIEKAYLLGLSLGGRMLHIRGCSDERAILRIRCLYRQRYVNP